MSVLTLSRSGKYQWVPVVRIGRRRRRARVEVGAFERGAGLGKQSASELGRRACGTDTPRPTSRFAHHAHMAAEADQKFAIDGASFEFCGGAGVETIDEGNQSLIGHIVDSLVGGMDISKVLIPTFFLEPRSLLEKYSDLFAHPHLFTAYVWRCLFGVCFCCVR